MENQGAGVGFDRGGSSTVGVWGFDRIRPGEGSRGGVDRGMDLKGGRGGGGDLI